jgi:hypothetical protein
VINVNPGLKHSADSKALCWHLSFGSGNQPSLLSMEEDIDHPVFLNED